jgi:hypothetical protein
MVIPCNWSELWKNGKINGGPEASAIIKQLNTVEELALALSIEINIRNCIGTVATIKHKIDLLTPKNIMRVRGAKR